MSNHGKPTGKQLRYLRVLAEQTGTTFATPRTRAQASREIERLRRVLEKTGRHVSPRRPSGGGSAHGTAVRPEEVEGWGSTARWRGTSRPRANKARSERQRNRPTVDRPEPRPIGRVLASYVNDIGIERQVVAVRGDAGELVLDRAAEGGEDARLVAHLGVDEPDGNAELTARLYVADPRRGRCRLATKDDLEAPSVSKPQNGIAVDGSWRDATLGAAGTGFRIAVWGPSGTFPSLRWTMTQPGSHDVPVSVRRVVGELEDYEPALTLTRAALAAHAGDDRVSTHGLAGELKLLLASPTVLNRRLRERVEQVVASGAMTMSDIARGCGRVRSANGNGETSWLARRIGQAPEAGATRPTPWVSSDVLALIARDGLGIDPREVELG
jgi:hypothetical protein